MLILDYFQPLVQQMVSLVDHQIVALPAGRGRNQPIQPEEGERRTDALRQRIIALAIPRYIQPSRSRRSVSQKVEVGLERVPIKSNQPSAHSRECGNPEGAVERLDPGFPPTYARWDERWTEGDFISSTSALTPLSRLLDEGENVGDTFVGVGGGDMVGVAVQDHEPGIRNQQLVLPDFFH
jgi:hypothetical protein